MIICWMAFSPEADWVRPENEYLSLLKLLLEAESHFFGPFGDEADGHPGAPSAGYGSAPCGPWWWQCGREKSEQRPLPNGPEPWYWPPETAPSREMKDHGVVIWPPSQPSGFELQQTSCAEIGVMSLPLEAMHIRSEAASAPPKAQQQPQLDWSRMSLIILAQVGQLVAESKSDGIGASADQVGTKGSISPAAWASSTSWVQLVFTPQSDLEAPGAWLANRDCGAATT